MYVDYPRRDKRLSPAFSLFLFSELHRCRKKDLHAIGYGSFKAKKRVEDFVAMLYMGGEL